MSEEVNLCEECDFKDTDMCDVCDVSIYAKSQMKSERITSLEAENKEWREAADVEANELDKMIKEHDKMFDENKELKEHIDHVKSDHRMILYALTKEMNKGKINYDFKHTVMYKYSKGLIDKSNEILRKKISTLRGKEEA